METADTRGGASAAASSSSSSSSCFCSSSSSSSAASSSSADATTTALAREACTIFQSRRYLECLQVLHQLLLRDRDNPKVIHNMALAEYFQDGCSDLHKLLDDLSKVKRRMEEINVREKVEGANAFSQLNDPAYATSDSNKGGNAVSNAETPAPPLEDCDTSIVLFNIAVILFHHHHFAAALSVLDPLRHSIYAVDEPALWHISVLMLDTALASDQIRKAAETLMYMEMQFGSGFITFPSEGGTSVQLHATISSTITADSASNTGSTMVAALSSPMNNAAVECSVLTRSSSEEVLEDDVLSLSLDMERLNAAKPASPISMLSGMQDRPSTAPPRVSNVKILLHVSKVQFYLCTRNIRAAKREIKLAMNFAQGGDPLKVLLLLKAQLDFVRGNHRKAAKLLISSSRELGLKHLILNNLGCIHYCLQKDSTAFQYLVNALKFSTPATSEKLPRLLVTPSQNRSHSILYNIGLQQLRSGNPMLAARCFQAAGPSYHNQFLFWLRLGECCIFALEKGCLETSGCTNVIGKDKLRVTSVGEGKWRTLLLPNGQSTLSNNNTLKDGNQSTFDGLDFFVPEWPQKLSLPFARHCFQNARHLISRSSKKASEIGDTEFSEDLSRDSKPLFMHTTQGSPTANGLSKDGKISSRNSLLTSLTAFKENQAKQRAVVMQHILVNLSFVELCLDNPVRALKSARELLKLPDCLMPLKFLGWVYAAEALCLLNRPKEAAAELSTCMLESNGVETLANGIEDDGQKWKSDENSQASGGEGDDAVSSSAANGPEIMEALNISSLTGTRAHASLFVNLAMIHVMLGHILQAQEFATQAVSITPASPLAVLSLVYVHLVQGRTRDAVALLKHCQHLCVVGGR